MTEHERNLLEQLGDADSLELAPGISRSSKHLALQNIVGNPINVAQFNIQFIVQYIDVTGAAKIAPAAVPAAGQTLNRVIVFGAADFSGGYGKALSFIPDAVWALTEYGIYGKDNLASFTALLIPILQRGDMVFTETVTIAANVYTRNTIVRCPQVAYGTLLDAVVSDTFILNMIRYRVDPTQLSQLQNQIIVGKQSIFGKTLDDKVDPGTYVTGQTFNQNIADIPIDLGIDKHLFLATYIDYDVIEFSWVITVKEVKKLKAN